jgi:glucose-1-phosphatase
MKAIIFDLGRVLVDMDVAVFNSKFFPEHRQEETDDQKLINIADVEHMHQYHRGDISSEEFYKIICEKSGMEVTFEQFKEEWNSIFTPMEDIEKILYNVKMNIRLGLLSDTNEIHWNYVLNHYGNLLNYFFNWTLSFEVEVTKPNKAIFLLAACRVLAKPEECVYIDDLERNVEGAKKVGMDAFQFKNVKQLRAELMARNLIN